MATLRRGREILPDADGAAGKLSRRSLLAGGLAALGCGWLAPRASIAAGPDEADTSTQARDDAMDRRGRDTADGDQVVGGPDAAEVEQGADDAGGRATGQAGRGVLGQGRALLDTAGTPRRTVAYVVHS